MIIYEKRSRPVKMGHTLQPDNSIDYQKLVKNSNRVWVFGYGSLVWKTGFEYTSKKVGFINGYVRRFWQGNTTHRGTPETPGRVATLVKRKSGHVWGVAFELVGKEQIRVAMDHLGMRECLLGGYDIDMVDVHARDKSTVPALVFNALETNSLYMGPAPLDELAQQVVDCTGPAGTNIEYVVRIADYFREHVPEEKDLHLFALDARIKSILATNEQENQNNTQQLAETVLRMKFTSSSNDHRRTTASYPKRRLPTTEDVLASYDMNSNFIRDNLAQRITDRRQFDDRWQR